MSMRKILDLAGLAAIAYILWITGSALYGPARLATRIPVHFNAAGQADGWGSPWSLVELPLVAIGIYVLMTVVARYPSAFNFPTRVTPGNRPRLEALAVEMIGWLKVEVVCLFAWIQNITVGAARHGTATLSVLVVPLALAVVFATIFAYVIAMRRA